MAIQYPLVQGVRVDPSSVELRLGAPINLILLFVSISWKRTRTRTELVLNHPDPVGKTRGKNKYEMSLEIPIAEYGVVLSTLGDGYGDILFPVTLQINETGFDKQTIVATGCSIDDDDGDISGGNALTRKLNLGPLKILVNGRDDLKITLGGATVQP